VLRYLEVLGVEHVVDPTLVRGLDYYTRTLFEVKTKSTDLGAQSAICGGGRYDNMVKSLGGADVPAIGFAMGLERILLSMSGAAADVAAPRSCALLPLSPEGSEKALVLARDLRALGVRCEVDGRGGKLKSMLSRAERRNAAVCVILGDELAQGRVAVKVLATRAQEEVELASAARAVATLLASGSSVGGESTGSPLLGPPQVPR
jgi:histidyl-tRNA synthetase